MWNGGKDRASRECQLILQSSKQSCKCWVAHPPYLLWTKTALLVYSRVFSSVFQFYNAILCKICKGWHICSSITNLYCWYFPSHSSPMSPLNSYQTITHLVYYVFVLQKYMRGHELNCCNCSASGNVRSDQSWACFTLNLYIIKTVLAVPIIRLIWQQFCLCVLIYFSHYSENFWRVCTVMVFRLPCWSFFWLQLQPLKLRRTPSTSWLMFFLKRCRKYTRTHTWH